MLSREDVDTFWDVVRPCLQEFHSLPAGVVLRKVKALRQTMKSLPEADRELLYHTEPFDIACSIVKMPLYLEAYRDRYLEIRDGIDASPTVSGNSHRPNLSE